VGEDIRDSSPRSVSIDRPALNCPAQPAFRRSRSFRPHTLIKMTPSVRKFALTAHITLSVGLLGAIASFLVLAVAGLTVQSARVVSAAYSAMELIARFSIVPLALSALLSGLIQSLGTSWGMFQHYWVVAKLLLTAFAAAILLVKMSLVEYAASLILEPTIPKSDLRMVGLQLLVHSAGGLLVLLMPMILSVYKPRGKTPYGLRKEHKDQTLVSSQRQ
jgi:hypothetical protein